MGWICYIESNLIQSQAHNSRHQMSETLALKQVNVCYSWSHDIMHLVLPVTSSAFYSARQIQYLAKAILSYWRHISFHTEKILLQSAIRFITSISVTWWHDHRIWFFFVYTHLPDLPGQSQKWKGLWEKGLPNYLPSWFAAHFHFDNEISIWGTQNSRFSFSIIFLRSHY